MIRIIGTNTLGYPEKRNFAELPFGNYQVQKKQNLNKIPAYIYSKIRRKTNWFYWNTFTDFDLHKVELFHFFNALSTGSTPWITTFETYLPRWGNNMSKRILKKGIGLLEGESCKKIIAMSACTAKIQENYLLNNFPSSYKTIKEKMFILHPAQSVLIDSMHSKKSYSPKVIFTLIGADFFRKGGLEVLRSFELLYQTGLRNWHLNIVSKMQYGDYASKATVASKFLAERLISKYPSNISFYDGLPNTSVLAILRNSHVGLLPTYADTYGYSVLEAQAAGCPVITTNIRALPEINNDKIGWIIEVPKDEDGNGVLLSEISRKQFSQLLIDQLTETFKDILQNPEQIEPKAKLALKKIQEENNPYEKVVTLEGLYDRV